MTRPHQVIAGALAAVAVSFEISCAPATERAAVQPASPPATAAHATLRSRARVKATPLNVYSAADSTPLADAVRDVPERVYVPNVLANTVDVIDPATYRVVDHFKVDSYPEHVTPSWDLTQLYVDSTRGNTLTIVDPRTSKPIKTIAIDDPYNLYFTPDGTKAIVVAERRRELDFRDAHTWDLLKSVSVPWRGVDHLDFSADGSYLIASTEFSGELVRVDTKAMAVTGDLHVGGRPIDVKLAPDGSVFFAANQTRDGVSVVDAQHMREIAFIPTGRGAHGLCVSRDTKRLYVSNRGGGSVSVIDFATRRVVSTWAVGGSPDMMQLSVDGRQLWVSNRYGASVSVIDTQSGQLLHTIAVGAGPHGIAFFPQPGRFSLGHNGVYR